MCCSVFLRPSCIRAVCIEQQRKVEILVSLQERLSAEAAAAQCNCMTTSCAAGVLFAEITSDAFACHVPFACPDKAFSLCGQSCDRYHRLWSLCLQFSLEEINMNLTLEENGIKDGLSVEEMGLTTSYCPVLCLYWCDDLTIA